MQSNNKYLSADELRERLGKFHFKKVKLVSTDTYSDYEVANTIIESGQKELLFCCALETAIVGFGNKLYGTFIYDDATYNVKKVYTEMGVRIDGVSGSKLKSDELTPRRLQRAFRGLIQDWLKQMPTESSYLWRKYSDCDEKFRTLCFPGSEHLVDNIEEAAYLHKCYCKLDNDLDTNIVTRIERVLRARGFSVKDIEEYNASL